MSASKKKQTASAVYFFKGSFSIFLLFLRLTALIFHALLKN